MGFVEYAFSVYDSLQLKAKYKKETCRSYKLSKEDVPHSADTGSASAYNVTTTLSGKVKQRQLLSRQLILKAVHISKNPIRIVFNPVLRTGFPDQPHKRGLVGEGIS